MLQLAPSRLPNIPMNSSHGRGTRHVARCGAGEMRRAKCASEFVACKDQVAVPRPTFSAVDMAMPKPSGQELPLAPAGNEVTGTATRFFGNTPRAYWVAYREKFSHRKDNKKQLHQVGLRIQSCKPHTTSATMGK